MEWWEWSTWGLALLTGIGGLVLGIRAELRSNRYRALWTPEGGDRSMTFYNRTGEDAMDVRLDVVHGWHLANYQPYAVVHADGAATFATVPASQSSTTEFACLFRWVRPSTGKEYRIGAGNTELARQLSKDIPPAPRQRARRKL